MTIDVEAIRARANHLLAISEADANARTITLATTAIALLAGFDVPALCDALDAERERNRILREALEWYEQASTWRSSPGRTVHLDGRITTWTSRPVDSDGGHIAGAALAATEEGGGA